MNTLENALPWDGFMLGEEEFADMVRVAIELHVGASKATHPVAMAALAAWWKDRNSTMMHKLFTSLERSGANRRALGQWFERFAPVKVKVGKDGSVKFLLDKSREEAMALLGSIPPRGEEYSLKVRPDDEGWDAFVALAAATLKAANESPYYLDDGKDGRTAKDSVLKLSAPFEALISQLGKFAEFATDPDEYRKSNEGRGFDTAKSVPDLDAEAARALAQRLNAIKGEFERFAAAQQVAAIQRREAATAPDPAPVAATLH